VQPATPSLDVLGVGIEHSAQWQAVPGHERFQQRQECPIFFGRLRQPGLLRRRLERLWFSSRLCPVRICTFSLLGSILALAACLGTVTSGTSIETSSSVGAGTGSTGTTTSAGTTTSGGASVVGSRHQPRSSSRAACRIARRSNSSVTPQPSRRSVTGFRTANPRPASQGRGAHGPPSPMKLASTPLGQLAQGPAPATGPASTCGPASPASGSPGPVGQQAAAMAIEARHAEKRTGPPPGRG